MVQGQVNTHDVEDTQNTDSKFAKLWNNSETKRVSIFWPNGTLLLAHFSLAGSYVPSICLQCTSKEGGHICTTNVFYSIYNFQSTTAVRLTLMYVNYTYLITFILYNYTNCCDFLTLILLASLRFSSFDLFNLSCKLFLSSVTAFSLDSVSLEFVLLCWTPASACWGFK